MRFITSFAIILVLIASSCSMKQEIYIDKSGAGAVNFEMQLAPYLAQVIEELSVLLESEGENPLDIEESLFDLDAIRDDFRQRDGVNLLRLEAPDKNTISGEATFADINLLVQDIEEESAESRMISLEKQGNVTEVRLNFSRAGMEQLLKENPSINSPVMESFGPAGTAGLSEEEYLEMMEFALGEQSRRGILESTMSIQVQVEGKILNQKGGMLINSNTVQYTVPLLPFLMLKEPLQYSLQYQ